MSAMTRAEGQRSALEIQRSAWGWSVVRGDDELDLFKTKREALAFVAARQKGA